MMRVRAAHPDDAERIASINVRSWQSSYRGIMPDAHLASLNAASISHHVREVIAGGKSTVLVAECPDVQGYCWLAKSRDSDAQPDTGELIAIYVAPDFERRGLGRSLVADSCAVAVKQAFRRVTLWALDQNHRAHSFYQRVGFEADGHDKTTLHWGGTPLREVRFVRKLEV